LKGIFLLRLAESVTEVATARWTDRRKVNVKMATARMLIGLENAEIRLMVLSLLKRGGH
jgi:hypothetical protein